MVSRGTGESVGRWSGVRRCVPCWPERDGGELVVEACLPCSACGCWFNGGFGQLVRRTVSGFILRSGFVLVAPGSLAYMAWFGLPAGGLVGVSGQPAGEGLSRCAGGQMYGFRPVFSVQCCFPPLLSLPSPGVEAWAISFFCFSRARVPLLQGVRGFQRVRKLRGCWSRATAFTVSPVGGADIICRIPSRCIAPLWTGGGRWLKVKLAALSTRVCGTAHGRAGEGQGRQRQRRLNGLGSGLVFQFPGYD